MSGCEWWAWHACTCHRECEDETTVLTPDLAAELTTIPDPTRRTK